MFHSGTARLSTLLEVFEGGIGILKMETKEKLCYVFPPYLDEGLWALSVWWQHLQLQLARRATFVSSSEVPDEFEVWVEWEVPCDWWKILQWHYPLARITSRLPQSVLNDAELIAILDTERATRYTQRTDRSLAEGYGILIGAFPEIRLPIIASSLEPEPLLVLVRRHQLDREAYNSDLRWGGYLELEERLEAEKVPYAYLSGDLDRKTALESLGKARVVVGEAGSLTLLASGMRKPVVELYPDGGSKHYKAQWQNPYYRQLQGVGNWTTDLVWSEVGRALAEYAKGEKVQWADLIGPPESKVPMVR